MNRRQISLTEAVKSAVISELDRHRDEIEAHAGDTSQVLLTAKVDKGRVRKVIYSRTSERDLREG
jgi:hypothetical protein